VSIKYLEVIVDRGKEKIREELTGGGRRPDRPTGPQI
jgi:hypothetical protein